MSYKNYNNQQLDNGKNPKKTLLIIGTLVAIILGLFFIFGNGDPITDVKDSTIPLYSEDITIGQAFENYFTNPKWTTLESNDSDVVVFTGYCYEESGDKIKITMEMIINDDSIKWEEVVLYNGTTGDTTYLTDLELESLLTAVYENGTFSWHW